MRHCTNCKQAGHNARSCTARGPAFNDHVRSVEQPVFGAEGIEFLADKVKVILTPRQARDFAYSLLDLALLQGD